MAEWFDIDTQPDGTYSYDTSIVWKNNYDVRIARLGNAIAGFALIGSAAEWTGDASSRDVREFFVIRRYRRSGVGREMARMLWDEYPGRWLVRVLDRNAPAIAFWRSAIADYSAGEFTEETQTNRSRAWRFFRFTSSGTRRSE